MPRWLYSLLGLIALPVAVLRLAWRGRREPGYRQHLGERLGRPASRSGKRLPSAPIWIHAVSVGETRAIEPLLRALAARDAEAHFLITHMTPAGRQTSMQLYADLIASGRLDIAWLPYDVGFAVRGFLAHWQPRLGLLVETEIWPTLLAESKRRGVPVVLVNARLSERSARRGRRLGSLITEAARSLAGVIAQTEADAKRIEAFGGPKPIVSGNLKFESEPDPGLIRRGLEWRAAVGDRPVVVVASTREHDGVAEEALLLDALGSISTAPALTRALIVIVPRHPQRFDEVAELVRARGLSFTRRSLEPASATSRIWIGDSLGELAAYYAMSDIAMVGGSWLPLGGQNLIEACACGKPVVMGPSTFNFAAAARDAEAAGALTVTGSPESAWTCVDAWLNDLEVLASRCAAALEFASAHRGATAKTLEALKPWLPPRT